MGKKSKAQKEAEAAAAAGQEGNSTAPATGGAGPEGQAQGSTGHAPRMDGGPVKDETKPPAGKKGTVTLKVNRNRVKYADHHEGQNFFGYPATRKGADILVEVPAALEASELASHRLVKP